LNRIQEHRGFVYGAVQLEEQMSGLALTVEIVPHRRNRPQCAGCGQRGRVYDRLAPRRFEFVPLWGLRVFFLYLMPLCGSIRYRPEVALTTQRWGGRLAATPAPWSLLMPAYEALAPLFDFSEARGTETPRTSPRNGLVCRSSANDHPRLEEDWSHNTETRRTQSSPYAEIAFTGAGCATTHVGKTRASGEQYQPSCRHEERHDRTAAREEHGSRHHHRGAAECSLRS
jgi:hypothetical protein